MTVGVLAEISPRAPFLASNVHLAIGRCRARLRSDEEVTNDATKSNDRIGFHGADACASLTATCVNAWTKGAPAAMRFARVM